LKIRLIFLLFIFSSSSFSQEDSLPYCMFKEKIVLYSDLGYYTAPFSINYQFTPDTDKLKYRNNIRTILGFGGSYKWFAMRIGIPLPGNLKSVSRYGNTTYYDLGFDFTIKKTFCEFDIRNYKGYAIRNANAWNDTLDDLHPNDIRKNTNAVSLSTNVWYIHNKNFKMAALKGKTGCYEREVKTWYLKNTLNIFGVGNNNESIVPAELVDTFNTKTSANVISAFDIGVIPGYAYVNRIKNWQFSILGGIGAVVQGKFYAAGTTTRGFLGLAPRYDFKLIGGYTVPKYFIFLVTDFDNKSIRFSDFIYRQSFYSVKVVGGVRLETKKDKEKRLNKELENSKL